MDEIPSKFSSPKEEIEFWKSKYNEKVHELEDLEQQFTEYQETSREVEKELEKELQTNEKKMKDATSQYSRIKLDFEEAMEKNRKSNEQYINQIHALEQQIESSKRNQEQINKEKRRLEQENDDLERKEREQSATIADLTDKVNKLLEDNAWLQTELEEQSSRDKEIIQRMKDEIRDLRLEVSVSGIQSKVPSVVATIDLEAISEKTATAERPRYASINNSVEGKNAISLVDDMLQLVKDMEKRFQLARIPQRTPELVMSN